MWVPVLILTGCAHKQPAPPKPAAVYSTAPTPADPSGKLIVTPDNTLAGKVATVNQTGRFVVLTFPVGRLPAADQNMHLYRRGLKVGEVKLTAMQLDDNCVADIVVGDAEIGDEVRDK